MDNATHLRPAARKPPALRQAGPRLAEGRRSPCGSPALALRKSGHLLPCCEFCTPKSPAKGKPMAYFSEKGHFPTPFPLKCPLGKVAGEQSNKTYQVGKWPFSPKKMPMRARANICKANTPTFQSREATNESTASAKSSLSPHKNFPSSTQKLPQIHTKTSTNPYAQTKLSLPLPPLYQPSGVPSTLSSIF